MSDTLNEVLKTNREIKANQKIILAQNKAIMDALGVKQFLLPKDDEAKAKVDAKAKADAEAEPPTLKELYRKGKASLKRRGLTQAMYQHMGTFLKGQRLQGDDYKQAYIDCYNVNGYGAL
jgi:thymidylate synthase ThyX|tara:strand:+ start:231 stop:590 length:360 start_codon:yes stop_codon:yes gene_type:complete